MSAGGRHPSDLALDRGGVAIEAHLLACDPCRARAGEARAARERFEREVLPASLPLVRAQLEARRRRVRFAFLAAGPALVGAAAAAILLVARPAAPPAPAAPEAPYVGAKGSARPFAAGLEIVVKRGEAVFPLAPGEAVRPRDGLRFVFRGERARHFELRVVGADGAEHPLHPAAGAGPAPRLRPGQALAGAATVDDAPGDERLVVRVADRPFAADDRGPDVERHEIVLPKQAP